MSSPMKVFVSSVLAEGDSYLFDCRCGSDNFKLVANRHVLDRYDERIDPKQSVSHRLARLPWLVAPHVLLALRAGGKPASGIMLLSSEHLAA
jgi:hypothetical protein